MVQLEKRALPPTWLVILMGALIAFSVLAAHSWRSDAFGLVNAILLTSCAVFSIVIAFHKLARAYLYFAPLGLGFLSLVIELGVDWQTQLTRGLNIISSILLIATLDSILYRGDSKSISNSDED